VSGRTHAGVSTRVVDGGTTPPSSMKKMSFPALQAKEWKKSMDTTVALLRMKGWGKRVIWL